MPQRYLSLWIIVLGIVGCGLMVVLAILGRDLTAASQTGPRWKRRLVGAALLLTGIGATPGCSREYGELVAPATPTDPTTLATMPLAQTPQWKIIEDTWSAADEIISKKKGNFPFNERGEKNILGAIQTRKQDVEALVAAGHLSVAEGGLLRQRLDDLAAGVGQFRPTELRGATCYDPMPPAGPAHPLHRLAEQLPLLEKLAESGKVHPQVITKVLAGVEDNLDVLAKMKVGEWIEAAATRPADDPVRRMMLGRGMTEADLQTAGATIAGARAAVGRIRARLAVAATQPESPTP